LSIAVSRALFPRFPRSTAGRLTKIRAQTVSRRSCVDIARATGVPERMRAAAPPGYEHQVQRLTAAESVLAEAVEAGIGACFL
jgi:ribonuclease III